LSLAFSTLAIALFVLMPGFFLEHFLYSGKMARVRAATPTLTDLAVSVAFSIPVHIVTLFGLARSRLMLKSVDAHALTAALAGQFGKDGLALDGIADSLLRDRWEIGLYLAATAVVAFVLGNLLQLLLLLVPFFRKLLPVPNRWFYTFFFPQGAAVSSCHAYILTKASTESRLLLYQGDVTDFKTGPAGDLIEVQLRNAQRGSINMPGKATPPEPSAAGRVISEQQSVGAPSEATEVSAAPLPSLEEAVRWIPLNQNLLIVPGDQIANISLTHLVAWRPLLILARGELRFGAGQSAGTVDLSRGSPRRRFLLGLALGRWLPLQPGIMVMAQAAVESTEQATASLEEGCLVKISLGRPVPRETRFQVVAVRRTVQDIRADDNFLLRLIEQGIIRPWARQIEARANRWP
jgi:hypothetical protein